jgi:S-methylmethionine-dependent homocysteine/selenocysteine methylase
MGTELDRRGVPTTLPLWSAIGLLERPDVVRAVHRDDLLAGAEIVTTNTFRATARTLARAGRDPAAAADLNRLAVRLAREAMAETGRPDALVAGSIAPLEDCYSPWLTPPFDVALAEHRQQAAALAAAGADFLLVETMPTAVEAEAALVAARETGLEATVGFVCEVVPDPATGGIRLLSGETLAEAVARVAPHEPTAILANCAAPPVIAVGIVSTSRKSAPAAASAAACRRCSARATSKGGVSQGE